MSMEQGAKPEHADLADKAYRRSTLIFAALILTALVLKVLLWRFPISGDEFPYLSRVYSYERGELTAPFQSFHVHFFGWLDTVSGNEVTQILAARIVMYLLLFGTCFYLFRTACYFLGVRGALFCVLCYVSSLFTVVHGASFRSDTPATFFFMVALYHFIVREDSVFSNVLAGLAMAVSLLLTIKAAIYLPVFAGWFLSRRLLCGHRAKSLIHTACFLGGLVLGFIVLYEVHSASLAPPAAATNVSFLGGAFSAFVTFKQIFPSRHYIIQTLTTDFIVWYLLFSGLIVHLTDLLKRRYKRNNPKAFLFILAIPLLSLLVYRNAFPYFFVFLMPTPTLFCGYAFERVVSVFKRSRQTVIPIASTVVGGLIVLNSALYFPHFMVSKRKITAVQHEALSQIHRMFPHPVAYIDGFSMVSSFRKVGFFMSPVCMENYLRRGEPIMGRLLAERKPLFLLENTLYLGLNSSEPPRSTSGKGLLETDWAALRSYFIHHWGLVWIVGKQFELDPATELLHFEIITPGPYTVESHTDIHIDGALYHQGDIVWLEEGAHTVGAGGATATVRLRWGDHLYRPSSEPEVLHAAPFF